MDLRLEQVSFHYPSLAKRPVFDHFSATLAADRYVGLQGDNGSGKTTLLGLILGLLEPQSGKIFAFGRDVAATPLWQMGLRIGYLRQNPSRQLFAPTVWQELLFPFRLQGQETKALHARAEEKLAQFDLQAKRNLEPFCLSTGEQKRLALAAMLMHDPPYLLLDEPGAGLDAQSRSILIQCLQERRRQGKGALLVSHDPKLIAKLCDRRCRLSGQGNREGLHAI